jgi:hypothetical protein
MTKKTSASSSALSSLNNNLENSPPFLKLHYLNDGNFGKFEIIYTQLKYNFQRNDKKDFC